MEPSRGTPDEPTEAERLATARRYRKARTDELRALVDGQVDGEVEEVGQFSRMPLEALAAVPVLGVFFALYARIRGRRRGGSADALVALGRDELYVFDYESTDASGARSVSLAERLPRSTVSVGAQTKAFMRDKITFEVRDSDDIVLYASSLKTNPWAAGVIRALGGDAPEPLDLGPETVSGGSTAPNE